MRSMGRGRAVAGGLMATCLLGAALAAGPALGQEPDDGAEEVEVPVEATALLSYPLNDAIPDTLLSGFPPQVVCVVRPDACPEELEPLREPIGGLLGEIDGNQATSPVQPVPPDSLAVGYLAGSPRYASALQIGLPDVPDGEELDQFVLHLPQGQPSYSIDSPMYRRIVMAAIQLAGSQDPEAFQEQLTKALQDEDPFTQPMGQIEVCPLTVPIPEDAAAPQSSSITDVSEEDADGEVVPAVDCLYGSNGVFDEEEQQWSFDLTFVAQAWLDGSLDNHGVLLRPVGSPNLAFGDPDTSTNTQTILEVAENARVTYASSEPPPPPAPLAPAGQSETSAPAPASTTPETASTTPEAASTAEADADPGPSTRTEAAAPSSSSPSGPSSASSSGSTSLSTPSAGVATTSSPEVPAAEVAPPTGDQAESQPDPVALETEPAGSSSQGPWAWLLLPVFAGGAALMARSLNEPVVATAGTGTSSGRGGALSRLVETSPTR